MEPKLTYELIDQIIYGMENQQERFTLDLEAGALLSGGPSVENVDDLEGDDRYVELPEWDSTRGFQLMEKFVAQLRNPVFRETLRESLGGGKGVFRKFKNSLKERPEIERTWYRFKEKEMRSYVTDWYNELMEARGLEKVTLDPQEETDELVLSDFTFSESAGQPQGLLLELDRDAFEENYPDFPLPVVEEIRLGSRPGTGEHSVLSAETPNGELAGFLWSRVQTIEAQEEGETCYNVGWVMQLYVMKEYRGLGLASTLLEKYLSKAFSHNIDWVLAPLMGQAVSLADKMSEIGFVAESTRLLVDVERWGRENLEC